MKDGEDWRERRGWRRGGGRRHKRAEEMRGGRGGGRERGWMEEREGEWEDIKGRERRCGDRRRGGVEWREERR